MQIKADQKDGAYILTLSGAPAGSVVEVRFQNTMNGNNSVSTTEVDGNGNSTIPLPRDFGQHMAMSLRVLTVENSEEVHNMIYVPQAVNSTSLVAVDSATYGAQQHKATAQNAPAPAPAARVQPAPTPTI